MKSKKGALSLTLEQLTKLILLSIIIILVFIPLGTKLYGYYFPGIDSELKKSLNILVKEAEDLRIDIEEHSAINPNIIIPIYLMEGTKVIAYPSSDGTPMKCKTKSCFCIFQTKNKRELSSCKALDGINIEKIETMESASTGIENINMTAKGNGDNIILEIKKL